MSDQPAKKPQLAQERTDMAEDRTVMANERTFAGWFRTGYAAVGIGLGFHALFVRMEPPWIPRVIATAFLLSGIYLFVSAERRACAVLARLHAHKAEPVGNSHLRIITIVSSTAVVALIAAMWLIPVDGS
jgi:putative membrane protein